MSARAVSNPYAFDEWSVTLDGRYVVRFCGVNAQELATQQLHELAKLLGFDDPTPRDGTNGRGAEPSDNTAGTAGAVPTPAGRIPRRSAAQAADRARSPRKRAKSS